MISSSLLCWMYSCKQKMSAFIMWGFLCLWWMKADSLRNTMLFIRRSVKTYSNVSVRAEFPFEGMRSALLKMQSDTPPSHRSQAENTIPLFLKYLIITPWSALTPPTYHTTHYLYMLSLLWKIFHPFESCGFQAITHTHRYTHTKKLFHTRKMSGWSVYRWLCFWDAKRSAGVYVSGLCV